VDRFHDVVGHTHKLVVHGWRMKASCHMALDNLRGVVQIVREHCRGTLGQSVQGERLSTGELRHDVDKGEGEGTQVLLGRVRS
jgi:hypothetical protein